MVNVGRSGFSPCACGQACPIILREGPAMTLTTASLFNHSGLTICIHNDTFIAIPLSHHVDMLSGRGELDDMTV